MLVVTIPVCGSEPCLSFFKRALRRGPCALQIYPQKRSTEREKGGRGRGSLEACGTIFSQKTVPHRRDEIHQKTSPDDASEDIKGIEAMKRGPSTELD